MSRPHPLDPIMADELIRAVGVARTTRELSARVKVVSAEAREPAKDDYLAWKAGGPVPTRGAFCVLVDNDRRCGVEVVVSLDEDSLVSALDLAPGVLARRDVARCQVPGHVLRRHSAPCTRFPHDLPREGVS